MNGPGKDGANAEDLLRKFGGKLCLVILVDGVDGSAFDVAAVDPVEVLRIPEILRHVADDIERTTVRVKFGTGH